MTATFNEDGTPVLIEALYARHYGLYLEECDTLQEAIDFLEYTADAGEGAPIGVLIDGDPRTAGSFAPEPPSDEQAAEMVRLYAVVKQHDGPGAPAVPVWA